MAVREQQIRTALERHGPASVAGDRDAERDIYQVNAVCEYPQLSERIQGKENLKSLRGQHSGRRGGLLGVKT